MNVDDAQPRQVSVRASDAHPAVDDRSRIDAAMQTIAALESELGAAHLREAALERAAQGKDELLSLVSHDLRSALNAMVGWVYLARSPRADDEARARALAGIDSAVTTQRRLVEQLLDASRLFSGRVKPDTRVVPLQALFARMASRFAARAQARALSLEVETPSSTLGFLADPARVEESMATLIDHAFAVAPDGSCLHLRARLAVDASEAAGGSVVLEVGTSDALDAEATGLPGNPDGQPALSLSMAIAREVTELQGGTLLVEAAPSRAGTRLALCFPALAGGTSGQAPGLDEPAVTHHAQVSTAGGRAGDDSGGTDPAASESMLGGTFILLVDDREDMLDVTATLLRGHGARVEATLSAQQALALYPEWARGGSERIVISDLSMPGMDGLEMIRRLRRIEREQSLPRVPGVGFSALADRYARSEVIAAGFDLFLAKPIAPDMLIEGISALIGR